MKAESNIRPAAYSVEQCGDLAEVVLFENIEQQERENEAVFVYDEFRINVPYRENLAASVEANFDEWILAAKAEEGKTPKPTITEELAALKAENAALRVANEITGTAVEELITMVFDGGGV